ncbi:hypothetical protein B0H15DRAFT_790487, partial [Mycena belliarum]
SPGHEDIRGNERADELAKVAAEMWCADETTPRTRAKRAAKDTALKKWTEDRKKTHPTGRCGPADRIPPAWRPNSHLTSTKREIYGRLVRCRTGHAFIGGYYAKFVPLERAGCQCGEPFQVATGFVVVLRHGTRVER